jgi:subtilisin family serine protease
VQDHAQGQSPEPDLAGLTQGEGDAAQYSIGKLGLVDIHRRLKGDNISVAVIDSQIDVHHPDLDGDIAEQFDAVGAADVPHSHGTGMAGAIASHRRLLGIAPSARIYAIHAFSSGAASAESTTFNILKSLEWAASKGVRVINMSFAGPARSFARARPQGGTRQGDRADRCRGQCRNEIAAALSGRRSQRDRGDGDRCGR